MIAFLTMFAFFRKKSPYTEKKMASSLGLQDKNQRYVPSYFALLTGF
jgi:hypothetical protein